MSALDANVYEINVSISGGDRSYEVEHRHPNLPDAELLVAWQGEAQSVFDALYPDTVVDSARVYVMYLPADERGGDDEADRKRAAV
jgi:hypothetical protein